MHVNAVKIGVYGWTQIHLSIVTGLMIHFKNLLPNNKWMTYVGRGKGPKLGPSVGFTDLILMTQYAQDFLKEFERVYEDAENGIFQARGMARFFCVW